MNAKEYKVAKLAADMKDNYIKMLEEGYKPDDVKKFIDDMQKSKDPSKVQAPKPQGGGTSVPSAFGSEKEASLESDITQLQNKIKSLSDKERSEFMKEIGKQLMNICSEKTNDSKKEAIADPFGKTSADKMNEDFDPSGETEFNPAEGKVAGEEEEEHFDPTDIEVGDLVDFGSQGKLYVTLLNGRQSRVTDLEEERFNPRASGWNINIAGAKGIVERGNPEGDMGEDDSYLAGEDCPKDCDCKADADTFHPGKESASEEDLAYLQGNIYGNQVLSKNASDKVYIKKTPEGEFRVPGPKGKEEAAAYYTDDKEDAIGTAKQMHPGKEIIINGKKV